MAANRWDHSNILMGNQAGSIMGSSLANVGRDFGRGIARYYERKKQTEKEEATVEWLNQNEQAVNALFPQLVQVRDPAERKKVIKAGIKGAGLDNLVQVQQYMDQQQRQRQQDEISREMQRTNMAATRLQMENMQALMDERATEGKALRAAAAPGAGMADQITRGARFQDLDPNAEPDRAEIYMREGGRSPQMIQAMTRSRPFSPAEFMTPSGLNMVQTSPNSFIPDPRVKQKQTEPKPGEYERIVQQLEASGAFDKTKDKLTPKEKALFERMKALNTRGSGSMTPEQIAAAITGGVDESAPSSLSAEDQAALRWAEANPTDPRSAKIKAKLGIK